MSPFLRKQISVFKHNMKNIFKCHLTIETTMSRHERKILNILSFTVHLVAISFVKILVRPDGGGTHLQHSGDRGQPGLLDLVLRQAPKLQRYLVLKNKTNKQTKIWLVCRQDGSMSKAFAAKYGYLHSTIWQPHGGVENQIALHANCGQCYHFHL